MTVNIEILEDVKPILKLPATKLHLQIIRKQPRGHKLVIQNFTH